MEKFKTLPMANPKKVAKESKVTFIIGNGFDLHLGMKTKYSDVYDTYKQTPSSSNIISVFKKELAMDSVGNYKNWSDFEMGMADYAKQLSSENILIECVRDFKSYMVQHINNENQRMEKLIADSMSSYLLNELDNSLWKFHHGLIPNDKNKITALLKDNNWDINFLTFNYTLILEMFLALVLRHRQVAMNQPIHIHGKLNEDVVLGIDNIEQLQKLPFTLTKKGKRNFVKTFFNEQYDNERVIKAKKIIEESSVICTYGFSFGESDKTWLEELVKWLYMDNSHHLVVYQYDKMKYYPYNADEKMDIEDDKKEELGKRLRIQEKEILKQIHIPIGYDIFNFSFKQYKSDGMPQVPYELHEAFEVRRVK